MNNYEMVKWLNSRRNDACFVPIDAAKLKAICVNTIHENDQLQEQLGDTQCMLTAFRHASNSIGIATGVTDKHTDHDEAAKSVTGDHYFLELIAESEMRYKRLKAAAEAVKGDLLIRADVTDTGCKVVDLSSSIWNEFKEALK
jgi:hypothetical protein